MAKYRWLIVDKLLFDTEIGANIPWPPQESEGSNAWLWIAAGNVPDPVIPAQEQAQSSQKLLLDLVLKIAPDSAEKQALQAAVGKNG